MSNIDVLTTEESIISNLMRNPDLLSKFKLKPEMFRDPDAQKFVQYILEIGKVDVNQIYYKSREDKDFVSTKRLTDLFNSKGTEKVFFMNDQENILQEYVVNQSIYEMNDYLKAPSREDLKYLKEKLSELDKLKIAKSNPTDSFLAEIMENVLSDEPRAFVKTNYAKLDNKILGFERSQLNILAGRPSTGKTAFALNIMWNMARQGYPTTFFSLETGGTNIGERLISMITNIPLSKIKQSQGLSTDETNAIMDAINQIKQLNKLSIHDGAVITPSDIREQAMIESDKPHIIFIDYLTLMKSDVPMKDRRLEVEKISRDLKIIAKETGCIIIALAQLSRGVESRQDKRPMMSDLRETGGIEQDAHFIFMLYRDDYYDRDLVDNQTGKSDIEVNVVKNKDGETGVVEMEFYKKTQRFY
ncbi:DnaB helicase C-terminal domain-containing protein [Staphylococcus schleiferi]|uniref:DnaB helicase C-terminal domain-containing protein n=1 Tax=Staphylococcus schleiferi TaxID=1295 RepID=UPI0021D03929|nr:DnaB helicase C-terminal domain-containing protein [Staphylococcus schleiferi]UXR56815.1 DnaB helicase C-terminal domain-containing protein [Staphylococcus schleiferi]UXR59099.1 DnaB helicase C-terminal domain-containing protein [Staphylococcus schleiferi]UXR61414.1 DnaB helicase C-terminal domain-containing protein [Staphylococcus schleiferi]